MTPYLRSIALIALVAVFIPPFILAADKAKPKNAKETKAATKAGMASNKLVGALQRTFKLWDSKKDDSVDKEEFEKFYAKLMAKPKKKADAAAADPMAAVTALWKKTDADSDGKISHAEFDEWAGQFAEYVTKYVDLHNQRAGVEREMANLQALRAKSGNVTALDGIFDQEARRGLITYKQSLERIDGELKELDAAGHVAYRDLLLPQLIR